MSTPKTLYEAISNGMRTANHGQDPVKHVENHIIDFLAQRFGAALLTREQPADILITKLWKNIKEESEELGQ